MAMLRSRVRQSCLAACSLVALAGCQSFLGYRGWPYPERDRTSFHTPAMRIDTVEQFASRSDGTDSAEQREYTDQLARQIQIEPDPLVREAILRATGEFRTPLAYQMLEAGLRDENSQVRAACCQSLGTRAESRAVSALANVLRDDEDKDVRLAAVEALGNIKDPSAIAALAVALDDHDPAMQYVGVQSMKSITGKDYGGDVEAWRQVAAGAAPPEPAVPSIAERIRDATRF
jgi:HEAT repeat protein